MQWTHILTYDLTVDGVKYKLAGTHGPTAVSGDTGTPKDRAQFDLQWSKGPFTATANDQLRRPVQRDRPVRWVTLHLPGRADQQLNNARWANTATSRRNYCNVASFTYVNLNFLYALNKQWTFQASIQNAFNAKPPVDLETYGGLVGPAAECANNGVAV